MLFNNMFFTVFIRSIWVITRKRKRGVFFYLHCGSVFFFKVSLIVTCAWERARVMRSRSEFRFQGFLCCCQGDVNAGIHRLRHRWRNSAIRNWLFVFSIPNAFCKHWNWLNSLFNNFGFFSDVLIFFFFISDSMGLHRVENPSHVDGAVSLHLYSPPYDTCHIFNQQTGKKAEAKVTFWSRYGAKVSPVWMMHR